MIFQQFQTQNLNIGYWPIEPGQCWAVLGRNGSGKKHLAQALLDQQFLPENKNSSFNLISFEEQQAFYEDELKKDDTDFMDKLDPGTTVRSLLNATDDELESLKFLNLKSILDRGYRLLSSGESRKALLAQALIQKPDYLILDEPYDSLDKQSKAELALFFSKLAAKKETQLIFLLNDINEIAHWHSHVAILEKGELIAQGTHEDILNNQDLHALLDFDASTLPAWPEALNNTAAPNPIIQVNKAKVSYGETLIFENINLLIRPGEHTLLTGPNGSGKSTLTFDHRRSSTILW